MSYYEIVDEELNISRDKTTAKIVLHCPFADAVAFSQVQVGGLVTSFGTLAFRVGAIHPRIPLYCNSCSIKPLNDWPDGYSGTDWLSAVVTLTYGQLDQPQDEEGQEIGDVSFKVIGEELVLPRTVFTVNDEPLKEDEWPNPIKIVAKAEMCVTFKRRPRLQVSDWIELVGKINQNTFYGCPPGTVMFLNPETHRTLTTDGNDQYEFTYTFIFQPAGWNFIWSPSAGEWVELDQAQYTEADFSVFE